MAWPAIAAGIGMGIDKGFEVWGNLEAAAAQREANRLNADMTREQMAKQEEFAKMGVQWRVADAIKAGIHPVYAMGASPSSFTPVSSNIQPEMSSGAAIANSFRGMGQDASRALSMSMDAPQRKMAELQIKNMELDLDGKVIDNAIRSSELAKMNQVPTPGATNQLNFMPGQGDSTKASIQVQPAKPTAADPRNPAKEMGLISDYGYNRNRFGLGIVPSTDIKQRIEDMIVPETMWSLRNTYVTSPKNVPSPKDYPLPKGFTKWVWNPVKQSFVPGHHHKGPKWKTMRYRRGY